MTLLVSRGFEINRKNKLRWEFQKGVVASSYFIGVAGRALRLEVASSLSSGISKACYSSLEIGHFRLDQYILMHSVLYRTEMLKLCQLKLPKHTFYVDNIYVYYPLPHVRTLYYLNVDFYRYFIGREDQSVNEKIMIGRIDQQLFVTKTMISMYELRMISSKKLRKYMVNYLAIMMTVSSILCIRSKKPENLTKKKELWSYLKRKDYKTYMKIRYGILGQTMNLPGRSGRKVSSLAYSVARRLIGFN